MGVHTIKELRQEFKQQGKFHTPPELAAYLMSLIPDVDSVREVYDPTCGAGALLQVFPDSVLKFGQDIDASALSDAEAVLGDSFTGVLGDVLSEPGFFPREFAAVVANPPFSVAWEPVEHAQFAGAPTLPTRSKADYAFLLHIMAHLSPSGTAVVLQFPGALYRGNREGLLRKWFIESGWVHEVHAIPGNMFTDTSISTAVLVLRKQPASEVRFVDVDSGRERLVPVSEIAANEFSLSVNLYVQPEIAPVPVVDPVELESLAQRNALRKLEGELRFSEMVSKIEGRDFMTGFIDAIDCVVDKFRTRLF